MLASPQTPSLQKLISSAQFQSNSHSTPYKIASSLPSDELPGNTSAKAFTVPNFHYLDTHEIFKTLPAAEASFANLQAPEKPRPNAFVLTTSSISFRGRDAHTPGWDQKGSGYVMIQEKFLATTPFIEFTHCKQASAKNIHDRYYCIL